MNLRVLLWANMGDIVAESAKAAEEKYGPKEYISSASSMIYHTKECSHAQRIKNKTNDIVMEKKKCKICFK